MNQSAQAITLGTDTLRWIIGGVVGLLLTFGGFAYFLGDVSSEVRRITQIEAKNNTQDTTLSSTAGNVEALRLRIEALEKQIRASSQQPSPPTNASGSVGAGAALVGIDSNNDRTIVSGDLQVPVNRWGGQETTLDSAAGNPVRCPDGQVVVGVRAVDTDGGRYCVDCISVVQVYCRQL